jgi:ketosteroid isomerase-like protein
MNSPTEYKRELLRRMNAKDLPGTMELIAQDAVYFWSNGAAMFGKDEIRLGMDAAFRGIQDDIYEVSDLTWLIETPQIAVGVYRFQWRGRVDGRPASGRGRGASVIRRIEGEWRTVHENLSQGRWKSRNGDSTTA